MLHSRSVCVLSVALALTSCVASGQKTPIAITADLSDASRKLLHADVDLPVKAGPLTLLTPEWIPGAHGPRGPVANIVGVVFTADGKPLPWRRDAVNVYEYHLTVPAGVTTLHAHLDCINTRLTRNTAVLEWESLMLYPANIPVRDIAIQPTVTVPAGWGIGTSLKPISPYDPAQPTGGTVHYAATTVEMLQDSPIMTGANFHEYALAPDVMPKHYIDVIGAEPDDVNVRPEVIAQLSQLVHEGIALYGPPHFTSYHFLLLLPSHGGGGGLEHHESSDNSLPEHALNSDAYLSIVGEILPHEYTHSWNGKYRRPAGLATPDYATPMKDELLWVYEGLTDYLGNVLSARIGANTAEGYRDYLALTAAEMDATAGRAWRSIDDTTFTAAMPRSGAASDAWSNWRRSADYYPEGDLVWLDVDTTIRKLTGDKKNIRDFLQIFLQKGGAGVPRVLPYGLDELTADLNQVVRNDWNAFFEQRVYSVDPHVNLEGIEQGGYKLVYNEEPTEYQKAYFQNRNAGNDVWFSLGVSLETDGTIDDVRVGGPADKARLSPGQKLTVVNGTAFSKEALHAAIHASKGNTTPIHLMVQDENSVASVDVDYHDGERYPALVRVTGTPDYLSEISKPLVAAGQVSPAATR